MSIGKMEDSLEIIRALGDYPNTENDLSAEELKELFDKGPELIKAFINNIIVPAINNLETNGVTSSPDTTLSASGKAADAAAVAAALEQRAPAGYGLGGVIRDDTSFVADLNDVSLKTGFYYCTVNAENAPDDGFGGGPLFVVNWANGSLTRQFLMSNDLSVVYTRRYKDGTWDPWEFAYRDTGWIALTLNSSFSLYNGQIYNQPRYRVSGNTVTIRGSVTPANAITSSSSDIVIATGIPEEYRPKVSEYFVCNGSVMNRWLCTVKSTGEITISKYGTTEYAEIPTGAWLAFCVTYQLGGF